MNVDHPLRFVVEQNGPALRAARFSGRQLQYYREGSSEDSIACHALLSGLRSGAATTAPDVCGALAPADQRLRRIEVTVRTQTGDRDAVRHWLAAQPNAPTAPYLVAQLELNGGPGSGIVAHASTTGLDTYRALLGRSGVECAQPFASSLLALPAVAAALKAGAGPAVAVWDLSSSPSSLALVTPAGVQALTPCSAGWSQIVDFVQKVLHLRFRSAATKLLFNDLFDFSDVGPQLAQELAPALRAALAELPDSVRALHIVGLPLRQTWILQHLATTLGLAEWQPDIVSLAQAWKLEIASGAFESTPAPGALTLLHLGRLIDEQALPTGAQWQLVESRAIAGSADAAPTLSSAASETTAGPAAATAAVVSAPPPPAAPPAVVASESPGPAKTDGVKAPAAGAEAKQAVTRGALTTSTPLPPVAQSPEPASPTTPAAVVTESAPSAAKPAASPSAPVTTTPEAAPSPPRAVPSSLARYPGPERARSPRQPGGKKALIAAGFVMLLVSVGIAAKFYLAAQQAHAQAESERIAAQARILDMEQQAKVAAERLQQEAVAAREFAIASTRQQLEEEARQLLAAERLAHAPGTLVLTTEPAGALVSIDGGRAQPAPLRRDDLRPGQREITITLPGYEPIGRTVTIEGTRTTDLGRIELVRQVGHLAITTALSDLRYELRSDVSDLVLQAGSAPTILTDLPTGKYDLVIHRPGWAEVRESIQIERGMETVFTPHFSRGHVEVSSVPLGAEIWQADRLLGHTPLVLEDVTPGALDVVLRLEGHEDSRVRGAITAGATLALNAELDRLDRVLGLQELATPPVALTKVAPEFDRSATFRQARVLLSFVVDRDGVPGSVRVEHSSHSAAVEPCIKAILQWRFSPGLTVDGRPANARVQQLFALNVEPALR